NCVRDGFREVCQRWILPDEVASALRQAKALPHLSSSDMHLSQPDIAPCELSGVLAALTWANGELKRRPIHHHPTCA
ncbi:MAG: hypothetical protein ACI4L8_05450, partial [Candidatus Fimadaptatus sp.]